MPGMAAVTLGDGRRRRRESATGDGRRRRREPATYLQAINNSYNYRPIDLATGPGRCPPRAIFADSAMTRTPQMMNTGPRFTLPDEGLDDGERARLARRAA